MSLIHEALKKVEEVGRTVAPPNAARAPEQPPQSAGAWLRNATLAIAALAVMVYAAYRHISPKQSVVARPAAPSLSAPLKPAENAPGHNEKGLAFYRAGRYAEASAEYEAALKLNPADSVLQNNCGLAAMYAGQTTIAEARFKEALRLRPDYPEALNNYGALIDAGGQPAEAVKFFEKALLITPGYADAELNLAAVLERLGKTADAAAHYESFLRLDPAGAGSAPARLRLVRLRAYEILARTRKKD